MTKKLPPGEERTLADVVLDIPEASVLDVLDHVLTKGMLATGDVTLGVAGVDLIYLRLSTLLCSADRVMPVGGRKRRLSRPPRRPKRTRR